MKHDDLIQAIEELGLKHALGFIENFVTHRFVIVPFERRAEAHHGLFLKQFRADVGSHDDDGVAEIDFAP